MRKKCKKQWNGGHGSERREGIGTESWSRTEGKGETRGEGRDDDDVAAGVCVQRA